MVSWRCTKKSKEKKGKQITPPLSSSPLPTLRMSTSHFMIELNAVSSIPAASMPTADGENSTSGQRKRSEPIVMTWPSGSS